MQALGMPPRQSPVTMPLMLAAERLTPRRISTGSGAIAHRGHLGHGEQLQLPHGLIIPPPADNNRPPISRRPCQSTNATKMHSCAHRPTGRSGTRGRSQAWIRVPTRHHKPSKGQSQLLREDLRSAPPTPLQHRARPARDARRRPPAAGIEAMRSRPRRAANRATSPTRHIPDSSTPTDAGRHTSFLHRQVG